VLLPRLSSPLSLVSPSISTHPLVVVIDIMFLSSSPSPLPAAYLPSPWWLSSLLSSPSSRGLLALAPHSPMFAWPSSSSFHPFPWIIIVVRIPLHPFSLGRRHRHPLHLWSTLQAVARSGGNGCWVAVTIMLVCPPCCGLSFMVLVLPVIPVAVILLTVAVSSSLLSSIFVR
jgi:hypothetical protein